MLEQVWASYFQGREILMLQPTEASCTLPTMWQQLWEGPHAGQVFQAFGCTLHYISLI